jgi:hypothetical protein
MGKETKTYTISCHESLRKTPATRGTTCKLLKTDQSFISWQNKTQIKSVAIKQKLNDCRNKFDINFSVNFILFLS